MRMVDMLELTLDILDSREDFRAFTLDGQAVLLEDHLEMRPEDEERVRRHVHADRLQVGPFYVLADGFLTSPEMLVRNLLIGQEVARRFGPPMRVGYLPDQFGSPAQYPQILAGFGIDAVVVWRGVDAERSEFWWQAPDGTKALAIWLAVEGYCNANTLMASPHLFAEHMAPVFARMRRFATTPFLLVMAGCDHMSPRIDLADHLARLNGDPDASVRLEQGTLAEHVARVRSLAPQLPIMRGDFRSGRYAHVLPSVASTRMYLKQESFRTAILLERTAEPLAALAWRYGERYPQSPLTYAWKLLLHNCPHDSLPGCSTDRVHRDMMSRYAAAQDVAGDLAHRAAAALAVRVGEPDPKGNVTFLAYNVLPRARREHVRQRVHFLEPGAEFHVRDTSGRPVSSQVLARRPTKIEFSARFEQFDKEGRDEPVTLAIDHAERAGILAGRRWREWHGEEVELLFDAELPACGYATFSVASGPAREIPRTDLRFGEDWAENDRVRLEVHADGTFDVTDKRTGVRHAGLGALESGGDRGDEYTFCAPEEDTVATTRGLRGEIRRVESGPLRATFEITLGWSLPARLDPARLRRSGERRVMPITTRISLGATRARVEVRTELDNTVEDHRLRAIFPVAARADLSHAGGQFSVDARPIDVSPDPPDVAEPSQPTWAHRAFVDVYDERVGLAVYDRGITEYQVRRPAGEDARSAEICLTLLRCVGYLSRGDLRTRPGEAGGTIPTPEAQCPGRHAFEYAVLPHAGDWLSAGVHQDVESYITPVRSGPVAKAIRPRLSREIELGPEELVFTALKRSEDGDALVVRAFNVADRAVTARLVLGWDPQSVAVADLAERTGPALVRRAGAYETNVGAHGIVTFRIAP